MRRICLTTLSILALVGAHRETGAQQVREAPDTAWQRRVSDVGPGRSVRIRLADGGRADGRWIGSSLQGDSVAITIAAAGSERRVAFSRADTLWLRGHATRRGQVIGGLTGAALMGGLYALVRSSCGPGGDDPCTGWLLEHPAPYILVSTASVGLLGSIVGSVIPQWHRRHP
jgi:hypothetical protein